MEPAELDLQKQRAAYLKSRLDLFRNIAFGIAIMLCPLAILPLLKQHPDLRILGVITASAVAHFYLGDAMELHLIENPSASKMHRVCVGFASKVLPILMASVNFTVAMEKP